MADGQVPGVGASAMPFLSLSTQKKSTGTPLLIPPSEEQGWVTVKNKQAVKAAIQDKKQDLPANTPTTSGASVRSNQGRRNAIAKPANKAKAWHDPDERDSLRATRAERTLKVTLPPGTRNVNRSCFLDQVNGTAGLQALEACGPSAAPNIWFLTFVSKEAKEVFAAAGDFTTKEGLQAKVEGRKATLKHWLKVHWIPYHVPMASALRQLDSIQGVKIIAANYDMVTLHAGMEHVRSTLRSVLVEAPDTSKIPYSIRWSHDGEGGLALVTMKGRAPVCLKCNKYGHLRKDCNAVKCSVCTQWGHNNPECNLKRPFAAVLSASPMEPEAEIIDEDLVMEPSDQAPIPSEASVMSPLVQNSYATGTPSPSKTEVPASATMVSQSVPIAQPPLEGSLTPPPLNEGKNLQLITPEESGELEAPSLDEDLRISSSDSSDSDQPDDDLPSTQLSSTYFLKNNPPESAGQKRKGRRNISPPSSNKPLAKNQRFK
jgi:hypothetical protein